MNDSSQNIVQRVRSDLESRNQVMKELYEDDHLKSTITNMVLKYGGTITESKDLLVFAILTFIKQCYRSEFVLKNNINAYLYSIAKYEYYRRKRTDNNKLAELKFDIVDFSFNKEEELISTETNNILKNNLNKLSERCKTVLTLWSQNLKMREIAARMMYKSEGMARKKKHDCLNKLKDLISGI